MQMFLTPEEKIIEQLRTENAALKEQITNAKYNYLGAMADCKQYEETIAQQAEAIRLKDEALIAVRDDLELRMRIAEDDSLNISNSVLDQMCDAIDIQPSPEILQARDEKVAEACAKVIDTHLNRSTYSTSLAEMLSQILSGEWRKYI